jgi:hypothetical protein
VSDYDCAGVSYDDLIESGQRLEPAEIDIGTTQRAFTNQPVRNGITSFTFSLDINIQNESGSWRDIFQNISGGTWPIVNSDQRKPLLTVSGSDSGGSSTRRIYLVYSTNPGGPPNDYNFYVGSNSFQFVPGTWFKCTFTVDGPNRTIAMYIDGQKQSEQKTDGTLALPGASPAFTWRPVLGNNNGYIKVKNVYWWNQVLSSDAIKLFAGLSVPGACYKTANTCYSTTYTCPTSACILNRYTCPDATWTLNGSVCLKSGQPMTAATVTCSCPVSPAQYTCPAGWTLEGSRCKRPSYLSCDNGGSSTTPNSPNMGWTTVKSAWKLDGNRCKRYTCSADTSRSGTYILIEGNSCKVYNSTDLNSCPSGYTLGTDFVTVFASAVSLQVCARMVIESARIVYYIARSTPNTQDISTTVAAGDDIPATQQYDYIPADPVMGDRTVTNATLTRTAAQVMAIQTTNATTGSLQGRQCMCSVTQYMDLLNKNCVTRCPVATYADSATRTCQPCPANQTSPEGSTSIAQCKCSYATPYWTGFSCMQQLNPSAVVTGSGFTTIYDNQYTIHEFTQSGSFTLLSPVIAKLLLVGGGAGGSTDGKPGYGGEVTYINNSALSSGTYNVTIGAGGGPDSYGECTYLYS